MCKGNSPILLAFAAFFALAASDCSALDKNIVTDYGADGTKDISAILQQAVDDVGRAGGGTVLIPGQARNWGIGRPVFVGYPNVTIAGEGSATRISGESMAFILGMKRQYKAAISDKHFPPITGEANVLDTSVQGRKFGLRTFDGSVRAAGCFPACVFAHGGKVLHVEGEDFWGDYGRGVGKPVYWRNWPQYTINLVVKNNGAGPMKGVICGVGAGGITPELTAGNITDTLTVWTLESDAATGRNLALKFKATDAQGKESVQSLVLSKDPVGPGVHRISVQLDFTAGCFRAWFSTSAAAVVAPALAAKLDLGEGWAIKAFEYGAFRFGKVTANPFTGTPSDGKTDGDWTLCGLCIFKAPEYSTTPENDVIGTPQKKAADNTAVPNDTDRCFPQNNPKTFLSNLALNEQPKDMLVRYNSANWYDGAGGFGYWLPDRKPEPIGGTIGIRDLHLFVTSHNHGQAITIGEAEHVQIRDIYEGGCGYHGVGSLNCNPPNALVELDNCRLTGWDASFYASNATIKLTHFTGGGGETLMRLVGCQGEVNTVMITGFVASDYYVKMHAGPLGGPMTYVYFCVDNEGLSWVPRKACFYIEPSLNPAKGGNLVTFRGGIYSGALFSGAEGQAVVELADPPGDPKPSITGKLVLDYVDLMAGAKNPCWCIVNCRSTKWSGSLLNAETAWIESGAVKHGLINYTGPEGKCKVVTYQTDTGTLPTKGTWLAGCHVVRVPDKLNEKTGAWSFKEYQCVRSGTYGTQNEPKWDVK